MTRVFPIDTISIERFLRAQPYRNPVTREKHTFLLRNFTGFVAEFGADAPLTVSTVQHWLKERSLKWPAHMVVHRAWLVERYINWLQDQGVITRNPFAELHQMYGPRTAPIVRALINDDSDTALQQLRQPARFGSPIGRIMEEHVAHMRALGYRYDTNERMLLRFDRFLQRHPELAGAPLKELIERWSEEQPSPRRLSEAKEAGRIVSKAIHRLDPRVPVLPIGTCADRADHRGLRSAHIYTDAEIERILQAASSYPSPKAPLRPIALFTMLTLAYCAGLRGREIVRLRLGDVELRDEAIDIHETKFFKHRRLPLAPGVMAVLRRYLALREQAGAPKGLDSPLFWNRQRSRAYSFGGMRLLLTDVLRRAGVKPARGRVGARIHDLRHTMVGHRMRDWYRSGIDPQSKLPYLATYLGHKDIHSTLAYLNVTPEPLQVAAERFRAEGAAALCAARDMR